MKITTKLMVGAVAVFGLSYSLLAQSLRYETQGLTLVSSDQLPKFGTFWFAKGLDGRGGPPLPWPPEDGDLPVYALPNGQFLVDDSTVDYGNGRMSAAMASLDDPPDPGGGGSGDPPPPPPPDIPNYAKYMAHAFSLLDTNTVALTDTNLYNALISFPADTNTGPGLQIARYGTNAYILKANRFDYSAETDRDFALLICDKTDTPTWKTIDLSGASDAQDGWLIQGAVPRWKVTDPMYMMVTNINPLYNAFFRAIPYSGPQILLTGAQDYDIVSNTVTLTAAITDLSGTTVSNRQPVVTVNGLPARWASGSGNTISIDTGYAPSGAYQEVAVRWSSVPVAFDPQNPPMDTKLGYSSSATLALDFENDVYLAFASDQCSPDVGVNYILFGLNQAQQINAMITDPTTGETNALYSGYVPYAAIVELAWDFTMADGVTPYTNDTYVVRFSAASTTLEFTNRIERYGVRTAAGCIVTYEEEDPSLSAGSYLNSQARNWIGALAAEYETLYDTDWGSMTQYYPSEIGAGRDNPPYLFPYVLTGNHQMPWAVETCHSLTNIAFSDFGYYMGHGNGVGLGGGPRGSTFVTGYLDTTTVYPFVHTPVPNWRLRKVALWACYTDPTPDLTAHGTIKSWQETFGIRGTTEQRMSMMSKNVGLFFTGELPQGGISGTSSGTSSEVAALFDDLWITGPYPFPGACEPTYSFEWVFRQVSGMCPEINKGLPAWIGFGYLPYTGIYDGELVTNNISHINR